MNIAKTKNAPETSPTQNRPPVVVVLGHVDHGKSSLLEAIREDFKITSKESGGITQHIGAYVVEVLAEPKSAEALREGGQRFITFLDTPGHEAFSALRSRGAKVADVAVLVVAADEGIRAQTKEAIEVIKKSGIPFIVALNKIDKPGADAERIKRELSQHEVFVETMGGQVPCVETSATTKQGIPQLLEMIFLVAEVAGVQGDPQKPASGVVIEVFLDPQRGPAATLLVREGTLRVGDIVGTKSSWGKIKILEDFQAIQLEGAGPGMPTRAIGFESAPGVGEEFAVFKNEDMAKIRVAPLEAKKIQQVLEVPEGKRVLNVILKADVAGSLEALENLFLSLPHQEVILRIVEGSIGEISEKDVRLAQGTKAKIFGFRTKVSRTSQDFANREGISVETFDVIYDLIQRVRQLLEQSVEPEAAEHEIGSLKVLAVFFTEKNRQIVGGRVAEGEARKGASIEVIRQDVSVGKGKAANLQKDKKDAPVVGKGEECGILYEGEVRVEAGDTLTFYGK
ncbi:MAG: translation initiation factor IF-2 [Candidatus Wildermuthbacteria bacterium]|nr:translation initiation factor IF-2 [Candidatus Wildermuthbacteria bacterium]